MTARTPVVCLAAFLACSLHAQPPERGLKPASSHGRRMALVIGNNNYPSMPLRNALNDAHAVEQALLESGFAVDLVEDANLAAFEAAVRGFSEKLQRGDVALFYYAGHGMAVEGVNYLLPIDFDAQSEAEVKYKSFPADRILETIEGRGTQLSILILDACRNNPYRYGRSAGGGLAAMPEAVGTLIAFSAKEGEQALDNPGESNGLYTKYLVNALREPGLDARDLLFRVQKQVYEASGKKQFPAVYAGFVGNFYFHEPKAAAPGAAAAAAPAPAPDAEAWEAIRDSDDPAVLRAFVSDYPSSQYVKAANLKLASLRSGATRGVPAIAPGTGRINSQDGLTYVWIPPGKFTMGCSPDEGECPQDEKPAHEVSISRGFWLGQTPVTVAAWKRYRAASGKPPLPTFDVWGRRNLNEAGKDDSVPIVLEIWEEARGYCEWVGGWLPAEAEWEYAARAGTTGARYGPLNSIAWYADNAGRQPLNSLALAQTGDVKRYEDRLLANGNAVHPVKQKQPNAWNLFDMLGNVWQWTNDWFDGEYYMRREALDPRGPTAGKARVLRGGSWNNVPGWITASFRGFMTPELRSSDYGFRCAMN